MLKKFILPAFAIAVTFAQPPGMGPGMRFRQGGTPSYSELKTYLSLTDTQITSITSAIKSAADANQTLRQSVRDKGNALRTLLDSGSTDAAAIGKATIELRDLRKQLGAADTKMREQVLSFLTADQKTKLKALEDAEKLAPVIGQAHALHLLAPPANAGGMFGPAGAGGPGPRRFGGPGGRRM